MRMISNLIFGFHSKLATLVDNDSPIEEPHPETFLYKNKTSTDKDENVTFVTFNFYKGGRNNMNDIAKTFNIQNYKEYKLIEDDQQVNYNDDKSQVWKKSFNEMNKKLSTFHLENNKSNLMLFGTTSISHALYLGRSLQCANRIRFVNFNINTLKYECYELKHNNNKDENKQPLFSEPEFTKFENNKNGYVVLFVTRLQNHTLTTQNLKDIKNDIEENIAGVATLKAHPDRKMFYEHETFEFYNAFYDFLHNKVYTEFREAKGLIVISSLPLPLNYFMGRCLNRNIFGNMKFLEFDKNKNKYELAFSD